MMEGTMKVRMLRDVGGQWPAKGEVTEVDAVRGIGLIQEGFAEQVRGGSDSGGDGGDD